MLLPHQKVLPTAKFFQVSIFFIPISLPEELGQEDENNKQVCNYSKNLTFEYISIFFYFHPGYSVAAQANRSMKKILA